MESGDLEAIIFGRITNLRTEGDNILFEALSVRVITFSTIALILCLSGEIITASQYYGFIGLDLIFAYGYLQIRNKSMITHLLKF